MSHTSSKEIYTILAVSVVVGITTLLFVSPVHAQSEETNEVTRDDTRKAQTQLCHFVPEINEHRRVLLTESKAQTHLDNHSKDELVDSGEECPEADSSNELTQAEREYIQQELNRVLQRAQEILQQVNSL